MECRQLNQLDTPASQERSGGDKDCIGPITTHCLEGCVDLGARVSIVDLDSQTHSTSSRVHVLHLNISESRVRRINKHSNSRGSGQKVPKRLQSLCRKLGIENVYSGHVAIRPRQDRYRPRKLLGRLLLPPWLQTTTVGLR